VVAGSTLPFGVNREAPARGNNVKKHGELTACSPARRRGRVAGATSAGSGMCRGRADFRGNAAKKARSAASRERTVDPRRRFGLEVEHLGSAPVCCRRASPDSRRRRREQCALAQLLSAVPDERRNARSCAPSRSPTDGASRSKSKARARQHPPRARGDGDFGYDRCSFHRTGSPKPAAASELAHDEKASISHRGRALRELVARMRSIAT